jgi:hypothetical protein
MISCSYIVTITAGCYTVIGLAMALHYSVNNFLVLGISWTLVWGMWGYCVCKVIYYFPGYLVIICHHLKLRLSLIERRLKNFMNYSNRFSMISKISMIRRLLKEHNNLCEDIDDYNEYWKKYLTFAYAIFVSLVCFVSYVVFISRITWFVRIEFIVILSGHVLLLSVITYSASTVSHFNQIILRDLYSIYFRNYLPTSFKLKVRLKLKEFSSVNFFSQQLMNYIEKVENNKIGFTLTNKKLITRSTFQSVSF